MQVSHVTQHSERELASRVKLHLEQQLKSESRFVS